MGTSAWRDFIFFYNVAQRACLIVVRCVFDFHRWDEEMLANPWMTNNAMLRNDKACDKPIIAAINGTALAGGCELVQGTDIRICADHAMIGLSEAKRGLFPA